MKKLIWEVRRKTRLKRKRIIEKRFIKCFAPKINKSVGIFNYCNCKYHIKKFLNKNYLKVFINIFLIAFLRKVYALVKQRGRGEEGVELLQVANQIISKVS